MLRAPFALIWNLLKLISFAFRSFFFAVGHMLTKKRRKWVKLKIPQRLTLGPRTGLAGYVDDTPSFMELRDAVDTLAADPRIEGVLVVADQLLVGGGRLGDLRSLIEVLRDADKQIVFHSHSFQGRQYDLALAADKVLLTPGGRLYYFGHRFEQYFARDLLDRLGVAAQFVHIGPFKGAAHRFIKNESPAPIRLMMNQVVDGLSDLRESAIIDGRPIDDERLEQAFSRMPLDDRQAEALGLIDGRIHRRLVCRWLEEGADFVDLPPEPAAGDPAAAHPAADAPEAAVQLTDALDYAQATPHYEWTPLIRRPQAIAVVDLTGIIVMPGTDVPGPSSVTIDPDEILPVLRRLSQDRSIAAVLLHINSPGGSALASELIWDGIRNLRQQKPTVAYCSDVAGSGGYYLAVGADRIVCHRQSIIGSIGVIAGKFSFPGTLDKLDIAAEAFARHETSQFMSIAEPLSDQVLANLQRDARSFYRQFLRRVGLARNLPRRRLHRYARGRIYTGDDAHRRHLVDELGNFDQALATLRGLTDQGLAEDTPLRFAGHRKTSLSALIRQSALTPSFWTDATSDLRLMHALVTGDPLLALMPYKFPGIHGDNEILAT